MSFLVVPLTIFIHATPGHVTKTIHRYFTDPVRYILAINSHMRERWIPGHSFVEGVAWEQG